MLRREFVRAVVSVSFAPKLLLAQQSAEPAPARPAPVPWTLGLNPRTPLPQTEVVDGIAETELRFFTPQQMATLVRLSDVLLPSLDSRPGALQAGTPLFLDFLIGSSPDVRKKVYSGGLNWLESESQKAYKKPFANLETGQVDALLKPWLRTWMNDHPPTEPYAHFINVAHSDIRTATVNSQAWSNAAKAAGQRTPDVGLYWYPVDPDIRRDNPTRIDRQRA